MSTESDAEFDRLEELERRHPERMAPNYRTGRDSSYGFGNGGRSNADTTNADDYVYPKYDADTDAEHRRGRRN